MKKYLCVVTTIMFVMVFVATLFSSLPIAFATCGTCGIGGSSSGSSAQEGETPSTPPAERPHPHDQDMKDKPAGPPEGREEMNKNVKEETDAQGNTTKTYTDSEGRVTRKEVQRKDGSKTVTDYNPDTGKPNWELKTYSNGRTMSDTRYDGRTGEKISEKVYRDNGSIEIDETWNKDGSSRKTYYGEDGGRIETDVSPTGAMTQTTLDAKGNIREHSVMGKRGMSRTDTYREDRTLESTRETKGVEGKYTEFDESGNPTLEKTWSHGMDTSKTTHASDGSKDRFEYNPDGSVKSSTHTATDGTSETTDYKAGEYFEAEGVVTHNP